MRRVNCSSYLVLAVCAYLLAPLGAGDWIVATQGRAGDQEPPTRVTRQIDRLVAFFPPAGSKVPLETLVDSDARDQLFRLESLLRLYRGKFPSFKRRLRQIKEVEDGLGAYEFAVESLRFARDKFEEENQTRTPDAARKAEQETILEGLRKKQEAARVVLARLLERSTLGSDLPALRALVVSRFTGWDSSKDLAYVKRELQRILRNVRNGRFDFNRFEDGVHEFRRQLRWFPLTIDSLDGLILVHDDSAGACPIPALEKLAGSAAARHRYSNPALRFPATQPCTISRCLLWQVVKTIRDLGRLKDEAEGNAAIESALYDVDVASSNKATPEELARARAIRTELFSSGALDSLVAQISSCKA